MSNQKTTFVVVAVAGALAAATAYFVRRRKQNKQPQKEEEVRAEENQVVEEEKPVVLKEEVKPQEVEEKKPVVEEIKKEVEQPKVEKIEKPVEQPVKKSSEYIEYYNAAKKLFTSQDYDNALINFDKSIEASPKGNPQMKTLIYSRASCLKKMNRLEESLEAYTSCIQLDPKYSRAYKARCGVYKLLKQYEKAMEDISFCYLLDTIAKGDMVPAYEETEELIAILSTAKAKVEMDRRYEDPEYVRHLPNARFITFYFNTLLSEKKKEYNQSNMSLDELKQHIDAYSKENETQYSLGDYYLMYGGELKEKARYEDALVAFTEAAKKENECKDFFGARLEKATLINLTGNNREAVAIYEELYKEKKTANLLVKFASCLLELGDDRYHSVFDEAIQLYPSDPDCYFHRGQLLFIENDIPRALADLNKVVQLHPNHAMAFVQIAFCYLQMNNPESAMQNMKRAIACGVNKAQVQNHYGEVLMTMGMISDAEAAFKKAIEYDVRWPYTYVNLATLVLQTKQDFLSASNYFKKAIKIDPGCVNAMLQLAQLHILLQEFDEATDVLKNALEKAISENDVKQVCAMMISMEYQTGALNVYQQMLKDESVKQYECLLITNRKGLM